MRYVFAVMLICLIAQPAWAADLGKGKAAYDRGDYTKALEEFRPLAEQGHAKAQFNLEVMYHKGHGVARDYAKAYVWFNIAAANGNESASRALDALEKEMTPEQIAEAQALTRKWIADHKNVTP